jgi:uncharacterized SAM-binding protein YcdF (DUF218 family)
MDWIVLLVKSYLLPGSTAFLLLGLLVGVILLVLGGRSRRWGIVCLVILLGGYWLLAMPVFSNGLERLLARGYGPVQSMGEARGAAAVVVLSGGSASFQAGSGQIESLSQATALRLLEGARLYALLDEPWVVLSGGPPGDDSEATPEAIAMQRELIRLGVPAEKILIEMASEDTHAQALRLRPLLAQRKIGTFVLVTSPWHLRRSMGVFATEGMDPVPSAAQGQSLGEESAGVPFLPSEASLMRSRDMAREILALIYYRVRGWI